MYEYLFHCHYMLIVAASYREVGFLNGDGVYGFTQNQI